MEWRECIKKRISKKASRDENLIRSLIESASQKSLAEKFLPNKFPEPKISLQYDALRTLLEALALKQGYKIYNHECYTAFLKEIMKDTATGDKFDEFRKLRNAINYYGKAISESEAKEVIKNLKSLIKLIKAKLESP